MAKIQPCRNGCGQLITVQDHEGKWKPFNVSEDGSVMGLHDCPNSTWNKQQQQGQQPGTQKPGSWTGTNKQGQIYEARVSKGPQESEVNYQELILKILTQINQQQKEQNTLLNTWNNSLNEMYNMTNALFKHFGLHEPQPLSKAETPEESLDQQQEESESKKEWSEFEQEQDEQDQDRDAAAKEERERNGSDYSF